MNVEEINKLTDRAYEIVRSRLDGERRYTDAQFDAACKFIAPAQVAALERLARQSTSNGTRGGEEGKR